MGVKEWLVGLAAVLALVGSLLYYEVLDARNSELKQQVKEVRRQLEDLKQSRRRS